MQSGFNAVTQSDLSQDNNLTVFKQKATDYYEKEMPYNVLQCLQILKIEVTTDLEAAALAELLLGEGIDLIHGIGIRIKNEEPFQDIVDFAKEEIASGLTQIISKI